MQSSLASRFGFAVAVMLLASAGAIGSGVGCSSSDGEADKASRDRTTARDRPFSPAKGGEASRSATAPRTFSEEPLSTPREFRAAFVTMAYNLDWPRVTTDDEDNQKAQIKAIVERAKEMNFNVIILQVRAFGDRIHKKSVHGEEWSRFLNNGFETTQYDPLCEWIRVCHEHGLELHAWVNPFRTDDPTAPESGIPQPHKEKKHYWHDPTNTQLQDRIIKKIIKELLNNPCKDKPRDAASADAVQGAQAGQAMRMDSDGGGIDGMLIDHYFPEPPDDNGKAGTQPTTRPRVSSSGVRSSAARSLSAPPAAVPAPTPRQKKVSEFVKKLYDEVKKHGHVKFGISPERNPTANPMAHVKTWLTEGWFHYMVPELYVRPGTDFDTALEWYIDNNTSLNNPKPVIVAGLLTTRVLDPESLAFPTWPADDIRQEVVKSREIFSAKSVTGGQAHFTFRALRATGQGGPTDNIGDLLKQQPYVTPALVPACVTPPPGHAAASAPTFSQPSAPSGGNHTITWTGSTPWIWEFWARDANNGNWTMQVIPGQVNQATFPQASDRVFLRAVDHYNLQGKAASRSIP